VAGGANNAEEETQAKEVLVSSKRKRHVAMTTKPTLQATRTAMGPTRASGRAGIGAPIERSESDSNGLLTSRHIGA
jgi:hypothetical protein